MNCQNCGEPLEQGTYFCESCGARVSKSSTLLPAHTNSRRKKKKRLTRLGILFAVLGSAAVIALIFAIVSIIQTASLKSDSAQIEFNDAEAAFSTYDAFASVEEQTTYWQSVYRSYLEQFIPERMGKGSNAHVLRFALLDLNCDGTPELFDCFANDVENNLYSLNVYYIDGGAIRLLGTADVSLDGSPMFAAFDDSMGKVAGYLSGCDVSVSGNSRQEYCLWGCQSNGELYLERLFFQQSCSDRNRLLEVADSDSIYYDSETELYTISVYDGTFVTPDELANAMEVFRNEHQMLQQEIGWFQDGSEDGSYPSLYSDFISGGMSAISASDELIDNIFQTYAPTSSDSGESTEVSPSNTSVYWSETDEYYHFDRNCPLVIDVDGDQLACGTVEDAIVAGHIKACPYCAGG